MQSIVPHKPVLGCLVHLPIRPIYLRRFFEGNQHWYLHLKTIVTHK